MSSAYASSSAVRAAAPESTPNFTPAELVPRRKPKDYKSTWGIFYTPKELSRCLAQWAVRRKTDRLLEPSFGGCGFLNESAEALRQKGAKNPWQQLCGCDRDLRAFRHLPPAYRLLGPTRRFVHNNFLNTRPADYRIRQFEVVLGNPPYVSRHNMRKYQLRFADAIHARNEKHVSRRASLWVYFIFHSLHFLRACGRMAWVLPRSLSQSDYGREVIATLCQRFARVTVVSLQKQCFVSHGAEEIIDVLLCDDYHPSGQLQSRPLITYASSLADLERKIQGSTAEQCVLPAAVTSAREELLTAVERRAIQAYGQATGVQSFGELARVRIGIVTGATRFFVLAKDDLAGAGLTEAMCVPLLTKAAYVKGVSWQEGDVKAAIASNHPILLVRHDVKETAAYWAKFPVELRKSVWTFQKRPIWNAPDDGKIPSAFFLGMVNKGPRLVVNVAQTNSNNSIHRVYFDSAPTVTEIQTYALLLMSSLGQVSGEMVGRVCGAGGLKFEPSDAAKLQLPRAPARFAPRVPELWRQVDLLLRNGDERQAIRAVDLALQNAAAGALTEQTLLTVESALQKLRSARRRLEAPLE